MRFLFHKKIMEYFLYLNTLIFLPIKLSNFLHNFKFKLRKDDFRFFS